MKKDQPKTNPTPETQPDPQSPLIRDHKGAALRVGDEVVLRGVITSIDETTEDYCNVVMQCTEPMYPSGELIPMTMNARQLELQPKRQAPEAAEPSDA